MSRTAKRTRSLVITVIAIALTNIAITYASGVAVVPDTPRPRSGVAVVPDTPRPKSGVAVVPDTPRPKSGVAVVPDTPRP
jgi:hypothetical protein